MILPCRLPIFSFYIFMLLGSGGLLVSPLATRSLAQITLDGSLGPSGSLDPTNGNYNIGHELGQTRGSNLFHSFGQFNIHPGERATFTGPGTIDNIVGRVTGGEQSIINGLLRSEIHGANLFLLNPSGVMFGPQAQLDVKGSFHVSTADFLRFEDGTIFSANLSENGILTVSPPAAFGFLSAQPAGIDIQGSALSVEPGETMSVVGGGIKVAGDARRSSPTLDAPNGQVNIVSVASAGEVILNAADQGSELNVDAFAKLGSIELFKNASINVSSENGGGTVVIRGNSLVVRNSTIAALTTGDTSGAQVGVDLHVTEGISLGGSTIITSTAGGGNAGTVFISATALSLDGGEIATFTVSDGRAGDIVLEVDRLTMIGEAGISSGSGVLGIVDDQADIVRADTGAAGNIYVFATEAVSLSRGSGLSASTAGGAGGQIVIKTPDLSLAGASIVAQTHGDSRAGTIIVKVERLSLTGGAQIDSSTFSSGQGGIVKIVAQDSVSLSGHNRENIPSRLSSSAEGSGDAGLVSITASIVNMDEGIIQATTSSNGRGGDIVMHVGRLNLQRGALIGSPSGRADSMGSVIAGMGASGNVRLSATEAISLSDNSVISAATAGRAGGQIHIDTPILTLDGGGITTLTIGDGRAGNIVVQVEHLMLIRGAAISSTSGTQDGENIIVGTGAAGNIWLSATESIHLSDKSTIQARTAGHGNSGDIKVQTGRLIMTGGAEINSTSGVIDDQTGRLIATGTGAAGNVTVTATEAISLTESIIASSTVDGDADADEDARQISIITPILSLTGGVIESATIGNGRAGNIVVQTGQLSLTEAAVIRSTSGTVQHVGIGNAGEIDLTATDIMLLSDNSIVTTEAARADGGMITVRAGSMVHLLDSAITSSVFGPVGTAGGDITVTSEFVVLDNSRVLANASQGRGGDITIDSDVFLADPDSVVDARALDAQVGIDGEVDIQAPVTNLSGSLTRLPQNFAAAPLPSRCAERWRGRNVSRFVVSGRDGLPAKPGSLLPSSLIETAQQQAEGVGSHGTHVTLSADFPRTRLGLACAQ